MGEGDQTYENEEGGEGVGGYMGRYVVLGCMCMPLLAGTNSE